MLLWFLFWLCRLCHSMRFCFVSITQRFWQWWTCDLIQPPKWFFKCNSYFFRSIFFMDIQQLQKCFWSKSIYCFNFTSLGNAFDKCFDWNYYWWVTIEKVWKKSTKYLFTIDSFIEMVITISYRNHNKILIQWKCLSFHIYIYIYRCITSSKPFSLHFNFTFRN